jgi:hypothetical protein
MRSEQTLDQRHAVYRLAGKINWHGVHEWFGSLYAGKADRVLIH